MSEHAIPKQQFRFTGKHMAIYMIAFFSVIIAVNVFMATLASKSWTGLIVKNSYVASQQYNDELNRASQQASLGWHSSLAYGEGMLIMTLRNAKGETLALDHAVAEIGRPAFEQQDKVLDFIPVTGGSNKITINLEQGIWFIRIKGVLGNQTYRRDARINVGKNGVGKVE